MSGVKKKLCLMEAACESKLELKLWRHYEPQSL